MAILIINQMYVIHNYTKYSGYNDYTDHSDELVTIPNIDHPLPVYISIDYNDIITNIQYNQPLSDDMIYIFGSILSIYSIYLLIMGIINK